MRRLLSFLLSFFRFFPDGRAEELCARRRPIAEARAPLRMPARRRGGQRGEPPLRGYSCFRERRLETTLRELSSPASWPPPPLRLPLPMPPPVDSRARAPARPADRTLRRAPRADERAGTRPRPARRRKAADAPRRASLAHCVLLRLARAEQWTVLRLFVGLATPRSHVKRHPPFARPADRTTNPQAEG